MTETNEANVDVPDVKSDVNADEIEIQRLISSGRTINEIVWLMDPKTSMLLHTKSEPVDPARIPFPQVQNLIESLLDVMKGHGGIGLSAIQCGYPYRVFVMTGFGQETEDRVFVNPEITGHSETRSSMSEGCLSIPYTTGSYSRQTGDNAGGKEIPMERWDSVTVKWHDGKTGELQTGEFDGIRARCIQHEIDHLDGILITDTLSRLKRDIITKNNLKTFKQFKDFQSQFK